MHAHVDGVLTGATSLIQSHYHGSRSNEMEHTHFLGNQLPLEPQDIHWKCWCLLAMAPWIKQVHLYHYDPQIAHGFHQEQPTQRRLESPSGHFWWMSGTPREVEGVAVHVTCKMTWHMSRDVPSAIASHVHDMLLCPLLETMERKWVGETQVRTLLLFRWDPGLTRLRMAWDWVEKWYRRTGHSSKREAENMAWCILAAAQNRLRPTRSLCRHFLMALMTQWPEVPSDLLRSVWAGCFSR